MTLYRIPEENFPTIHAIEERAAKFKKLYMKRLKKHEGRKPNKELFVTYAACSLFEEKNPGRKIGFTNLIDWLQRKYNPANYDFDMAKLYKWKTGRPFKEMQWGITWDDLKTIYEISCNGATRGEMSPRKIQRKHGISKKELEDFTGLILSQHSGNKKTSNKFIFNRPDK
ncbi:hypothetical protein ES703_21928 [subsurface metagenome]